MSVWRRIVDTARDRLANFEDRTFGRSKKPLGELSDRELEEELIRRRRERSQRRGGSSGSGEPLPPEERRPPTLSPQEQQLAQYYANLELPYGASLEDVRKSYREMMRKYHPDKHAGNPERHKAATELAASLTNAYRILVDHLSPR